MKRALHLQPVRRPVLLAGALLCMSAAPAAPATVTAFVHHSTASNVRANWTVIDHPATNGDPGAIVMVTPNYNPGGSGATYVNHPIGVWYTNGKWAIFNQDQAAMPKGAAFNVLVLDRQELQELKPLKPKKEVKTPEPKREAGPASETPVRKVWKDGRVRIEYPDRTTVEVTSRSKKVTAPDGTETIQPQAPVPLSAPPAPADAATVRWLDRHSEVLLAVIRTLVSNDEDSMRNYLRQEEKLSLLGRIAKRGQTIESLLASP